MQDLRRSRKERRRLNCDPRAPRLRDNSGLIRIYWRNPPGLSPKAPALAGYGVQVLIAQIFLAARSLTLPCMQFVWLGLVLALTISRTDSSAASHTIFAFLRLI